MTSQLQAARGREGEMAQIEEIKRTDKRRGGGGERKLISKERVVERGNSSMC